jgi:hypothetical protein
MRIGRGTEVLGENCSSASLSTTNPTWPDLGSNPGITALHCVDGSHTAQRVTWNLYRSGRVECAASSGGPGGSTRVNPRESGLIGGKEVIRISEAKCSPKTQTKKLRAQINENFNDIYSADENKYHYRALIKKSISFSWLITFVTEFILFRTSTSSCLRFCSGVMETGRVHVWLSTQSRCARMCWRSSSRMMRVAVAKEDA